MLDPSTDLSPATNPDAQAALSQKHGNGGILLIPLDNGRIALFDRSFTLRDILDEAPSAQLLKSLSRTYWIELTHRAKVAAESRFYGEPDDKELAKDIKRANAQVRPTRPTSNAMDLDDLL